MKTKGYYIIILACFCLMAQTVSAGNPWYLKESALVCEDYETVESYLDTVDKHGKIGGKLQQGLVMYIQACYYDRGCVVTAKRHPIVIIEDSGTIAKILLIQKGEFFPVFTQKENIIYPY